MTHWIIALALATQASPTLVEDRCAGSRFTRGNLSVSLSIKQIGEGQPFAEYIHIRSLSDGGKLELTAAYMADARGSLTPRSLSMQTLPQRQPEDGTRETIKWRLADGPWASYPYLLNADQRGNYYYRIAQSGSPGSSLRTEWLDRLPQGGRFSVIRVTETGEEMNMVTVDYPDAAVIAEVFAAARTQALAKLAPCSAPVHFVRQAPSN
jgi:hypothetical protein